LNRLSSSRLVLRFFSKLDLKFNNSLMLDASDRDFLMTMDRLGVELSFPDTINKKVDARIYRMRRN